MNDKITFDHRNGDKATGTKLITDLTIDTIEQYKEIVIESSITDKMTVSENSKIGQLQRNNPTPWGKHKDRLAPCGIRLVLEDNTVNPYRKNLTPKMEERIKTGWKCLKFYRELYHSPNATETDKSTAINRAGRDACKAISPKGIWSGWSSKAAFGRKK